MPITSRRSLNALLPAMLLLASGMGLTAAEYSWQDPQATILPGGGLAWAPKPFTYVKGASVRYIDYVGGDDSRDGASPTTAWKHHPWDADAAGTAKACSGIQTYVFKGGVAYRGSLTARDSGKPGDPIRLTRDPAWGTGAASFNGALDIAGGWKQATAADAPGIPKVDQVWYCDVGADKKASSLWQIEPGKSGDKSSDKNSDEGVTRMQLARWPDFDGSDPDHPLEKWAEFGGYDFNTGRFSADALKGLGDKTHFDGATLWTEGAFLMGSAHKAGIAAGSYDPVGGSFIVNGRAKSEPFKRIPTYAKTHFMLENLPQLLDAPGEFFFNKNTGRLFIWPAKGVDPNHTVYALAQVGTQISMTGQHDIEINGLDFRFTDPNQPSNFGAPSVVILGDANRITVRNCVFRNVAGAVSASPYATGGGEQLIDTAATVQDDIIVSDNDIAHVEKGGAIYINGSNQRNEGATYARLVHVEVLRNKVSDTGFRHGTATWGSLPAISVNWPETAEIAGNIVDHSYGNGIITFGGKGSGAKQTAALTRLLVHHNLLEDTMLDCNDYGGLEHFQGGPLYLYGNVTRNAVGNSIVNRHELGYALYLDGGFKCYTFNNIIAGKVKENDPDYYNYAGYFMCFGFLDQLFNNTIYHVNSSVIGNSGNRSNILGNVMVDAKKTFIGQNQPGDVSMLGGGDNGSTGQAGIPTMAYANNVFFGSPTDFGCVAGISSTGSYRGAPIVPGKTVAELSEKLQAEHARLATIGWQVDAAPLADPAKFDYRPTGAGTAGRGVKYFVPWGLARTVGEWNFFKSPSNPQTVLGEAFYMTDEYLDRDMYYFLPRQDLTVSTAKAEDYVTGGLEDWIEGALSFDGKRVATLTHAEMTRNMTYPGNKKHPKGEVYDGSKRETVDMGSNDFMIEVVFKTTAGQTAGTLAAKTSGAGYELAVGSDGKPVISLRGGDGAVKVAGQSAVNDGNWHHLLLEVDRAKGHATFYLDGKISGSGALDGLAKTASLANTADFQVGKDLNGAVDFLRVCRSTLAESKTTIDELYTWEFHGPQLGDFGSTKPISGKRDAGAVQGK